MDYLAVSFPRSAADMQEARALLGDEGKEIGLVAKLERAEAVANDETLDAIIEASEAVMVARGDLGVEIGDEALIGTQKRIIKHARSLNRAVITATQMMESMIESPLPTRAEVFDVANAVLDATDAVMLSAETAAGDSSGGDHRSHGPRLPGCRAGAHCSSSPATASMKASSGSMKPLRSPPCTPPTI